MIVTLTLNPALRVSYTAQRLALGAPNLVSQVRYRASGAGFAVARVLHTFGHEVVAAGLAGGAAGELIRAELARSGVATQFTPIAMETRRVIGVTDAASGQVTEFAEPAPYITTEELGRLAADYRALMDGATAVVLCGSLPAGLPAEIYASLASYAAEAGVRAILDARGRALWHALPRRPALVLPEPPGPAEPPGQGRPPAAEGAVPAGEPGAAGLLSHGAQAVAHACGGTVQVLTAGGRWRAWLPPAPPAGPGWPHEALVAGFVPGIALGWSWPDMLRHAVALAAAAQSPGEVDLGRYEALLPDVQVEPGQ
jgi:tagatose 6-phosphate kinase